MGKKEYHEHTCQTKAGIAILMIGKTSLIQKTFLEIKGVTLKE